MCGIFGVILNGESSRWRVQQVRTLFTELALAAASRGQDAAGFAVVDKQGFASVHRMPESSIVQVRRGIWQQRLLTMVGRNTKALLGHTRAATHGPNVLKNAHPHVFRDPQLGPLIGTHNGVIFNYRQIFPFKGEPFENDSANLFAMLSMYPESAWPEAFQQVLGWYALAMHRGDRLYFVRNSAPCVFAGIPALGAMVYASTYQIIRMAAEYVEVDVIDPRELPSDKLLVLSLNGEVQYTAPLQSSEAEDNWHRLLASGMYD